MENETFVPEIDTTVNLSATAPAVPEPPAHNDIATSVTQACERLSLDDDATQRITHMMTAAGATTATDELVSLLAQALRHDEDVSNAEATGYLRGRNENIDETLARRPTPNSPYTPSSTSFPRYIKRSIWD